MKKWQALISPLSRRKMLPTHPRTFGVPLPEVTSRNPSSSGIPFAVERMCRYIYCNGIDHEGVFRVNGNAKTVEKIKEAFDKTGDADLEAIDDVMAVAGTLKQFFRDLPDSLIPESHTSVFIRAQEDCRQDRVECVKRLKVLLEGLPQQNFHLLKYISRFLIEVAKRGSQNKMSVPSLAIVFGPSLFRCSDGLERFKDQGVANEIVHKFMSDYEELFGKLDERMSFQENDIVQRRIKDSQPPKHHGAAPARPPPPRLPSVDGASCPSPRSRNSDSGGDDGQQQTPPPRLRASDEDFLERASPFTMADSDGTSTVASPILTAGASEFVDKAISSTVTDFLFPSMKGSAGVSSRETPTNLRTSADAADRGQFPVKAPRRVSHQSSVDATASVTHDSMDSGSNLTSSETESSPKTPSMPKPRAGRTGSGLAASTASASDVIATTSSSMGGVPAGNVNAVGLNKNEMFGPLPDLDLVTRQDIILNAVRKPKGPANRRRASRPSFSAVQCTVISAVEKEMNNNEHLRVDKHAQDTASMPDPITADKSATEMTAALGSNGSNGIVESIDGGSSPMASELPFRVPPLDLGVLGASHSPSSESSGKNAAGSPNTRVQQHATVAPPRGHRLSVHKDDEQGNDKELYKKIKDLKAIENFEDSVEVEHGHRPPYQDKTAHPAAKKALTELTRARKETKGLEMQLQKGLSGSAESLDSAQASPGSSSSGRDDHYRSNGRGRKPQATGTAHAAAANAVVAASHPPRAGGLNHVTAAGGDGAQLLTSKEADGMRQTLDFLLRRLRDKRLESNRPEDLSKMTPEQVQDEKLSVQKALLHFEGQYGRPSSKADKELMKPLYERYRQIKKCLAALSRNGVQLGCSLSESMELANVSVPFGVSQQLSVSKKQGSSKAAGSAPADLSMPADTSPLAREQHASLQAMSSQELLKEQTKTLAEKRKLHQILRTFEDNFMNEHGRAVQKEDRVHMKSQYREYKYIKSKIRLIESLLAKHA